MQLQNSKHHAIIIIPLIIGEVFVATALEQSESVERNNLDDIRTFSNGIAHEFNNVFQIIRGYTNLTSKSFSFVDKEFSYANKVQNAVIRGKYVVNQLLKFSSCGTGNFEEVVPDKFLHELMPLIKNIIGSEINFSTNIEKQNCTLMINPSQIEEVILNICANSRDAAEKDGKIMLSLTSHTNNKFSITPNWTTKNRFITISIEDSGVLNSQLSKLDLFSPFTTTKLKDEGIGLGLSVAHGILRNHGGYIKFEKLHKFGTRTTIFLPSSLDQVNSTTAAF